MKQLKNKNNRSINKKELRKFGRNLTLVFMVWGILIWWRGKSIYPIYITLSVVSLILTIFFPKIIDLIEKNWLRLTKFIAKIITIIVLCIFYYLILTPVGVMGRLFGGKFLDIKIDKNRLSYWIVKKTEKVDDEYYLQQF